MALSEVTSQGWFQGSEQTRGLQFSGAIELLRLLDRLSSRPRWPSRDVPLPIVQLRRPPGAERPLEPLANRPADAIAIVFLSVLTPSTANSFHALVEELRGVWVAQKNSDVPIKMLLANGGEGPGGRASRPVTSLRTRSSNWPRAIAAWSR